MNNDRRGTPTGGPQKDITVDAVVNEERINVALQGMVSEARKRIDKLERKVEELEYENVELEIQVEVQREALENNPTQVARLQKRVQDLLEQLTALGASPVS